MMPIDKAVSLLARSEKAGIVIVFPTLLLF
jgi:hypothetical protein